MVGIDFSHRFVAAADALRIEGALSYERTEEGDLTTRCEARVPTGIDRHRVRFEAGDAGDLRPDLGRFDAAILVNLLDRLPRPRLCLDRLPDLLNPGGQLVIASPYTWLADYTPREQWLGGYSRAGQEVRGFDTVREILEPNFEFIRTVELPFLLREHARKFQWSVSLAGIWHRR